MATSRAPTGQPNDADREYLELLDEFLTIRRDLIALQKESLDVLEHIHASQSESAVNLLHYVALRSRDLRPLQMRLAKVGLSSVGRAESHVLSAVDQVLAILHRILRRPWQPGELENTPPVDLERGSNSWCAYRSSAWVRACRPGRRYGHHAQRGGQRLQIVHHLLNTAWIACGSTARTMTQPHGAACSSIFVERSRRPAGNVVSWTSPALNLGPARSRQVRASRRDRRATFGHVTRPARIWFSAASATQAAHAS